MDRFRGLGSPSLTKLLEQVDLRLACVTCSKKKQGNTYIYQPSKHNCSAQLLLAKSKEPSNAKDWYEVRQRPSYPVPSRYVVCWHYYPGKGCVRHQANCTFAWSKEEVLVWSFERTNRLERHQLRSMLLPTSSLTTADKEPKNWEEILSHFGGQFQNICEQCFYQSPPKVTLTDLCQCHPRPMPLLAHIVIDDTKKQCNIIRPLPSSHDIRLCSQSSRGYLCRTDNGQCPHAHSEVELVVWRAEQSRGLTRGKIKKNQQLNMGFYCRLCLVTANTQESFEVHCASFEHGRMISTDSLLVWNHRSPPLGMSQFSLCGSPLQCIYGIACPKAHSQEELQEWILRVKVTRRNKQLVEEEGLQSYQDRLVQEYQLYSSEIEVLSEKVEGVKITCSHPLKIHSKEKLARRTWDFTLHSKMPLLHVALLKTDPGAIFSLDASDHKKPCHYAGGHRFLVKGSRTQYKLSVHVQCSAFGVFEQWLTLDFGIRPVLLQKIFMQVGGQEETLSLQNKASDQRERAPPSSERWYPDKLLFIPCKERTLEEKKLLEMYKPPSMNPCYVPITTDKQPLTVANYKQMMHLSLLQEEAAREQVISRLNLKAMVTFKKMVSDQNEMKFAPPGELYAEVPLPSGMTQDAEEGYLLQRSVLTAIIAPCPLQNDRVYEVLLEPSIELEGSVVLKIPERCCKELSIEQDASTQLEVQFQIDRLPFCIYHEAVDRLLDEKLLLPDLSKCQLPTYQGPISWGNKKQQLAISYIVGAVTGKEPVAPLLIYGPFGTGKTSTLAQAALQVIKQPHARVLICTHNNSAADLYIQDHFHPYVEIGHPEATPLRVKYINSPINRTSPITRQYCPLSPDKSTFISPPLSLLDNYRIVVTTAVTSRDLDVPRGYFTHILLDEAAQMMESEALIPLALANHHTRLVVAGDHMQETPRFFNRRAGEEHTLLTRLFSHYQGKDCPVAQRGRIIFHQNYRSVPSIISFVSRCFYVSRNNAIEACAEKPMQPPQGSHALGLFHCHGLSSSVGNSWVNQSEMLQVVEVVKEILHQWPEQWGKVNRSKICVVSHGSQVKLIRQELRKIKLSDVTVTNYDNIIGCEYFVIILSTVRSVDSLPVQPPSTSTFSLDFFCDPRVLNTILTRARAQVIVVGDVVALCSFGGCSRIWRNYLRECVEAGSSMPADLNVEEIKQVVCGLQAWRQQLAEEDAEEDRDSWASDLDINSEDAILQELLDGEKGTFVTVTEEGMLEVKPKANNSLKEDKYTHFPTHILEQYLYLQPSTYKKCQLIKENFDRGYAVTLEECPPRRIPVNGRSNCGLGFTGDKVVVQLLSKTNHESGKVVGILEAGEKNRRFICFMDPRDRNSMIPIDRSVTKIFCMCFKDKPNYIPIRKFKGRQIVTERLEKLTEDMRRNCLFLVEVVCWREHCYYPLGIVNRIIPRVLSLEQGLNILNLEFGIENDSNYPKEVMEEIQQMPNDISDKDRKDCRGILVFTVDPAHAKDLDDAISVQDQGEYYEIGVHITDLAAVIPQGGALDKEAKRRGVTFYSVTHDVIHMLPLKLCSDLCSLKPNCDRRAVSLFVKVKKDTHEMVDGNLCHTIICSKRQLSYEEANSILEAKSADPPTFSTVEGCLFIIKHFSEVHRMFRLENVSNYKQPDEDCPPGHRNAQRMIEELMIMYNSWVADCLTSKDKLMNVMPVRCQNGPSLPKIEELRTKFQHLLPFSSYLSHHLLDVPELPRPSSGHKVTMLTSVWKQLLDAAVKQDHARITDLLATEDLHPELCYAVREFRRQLGRSFFIRSGSPNANGHYSLQLCAYTWASSPLRRYIDIVVQRLLQRHLKMVSTSLISPEDMDLACLNFDLRVKRESAYEKIGHALRLALSLHNEVQQKLAVIISADAKSKGVKVAFPLNGDSLSNPLSLDYSVLQPVEQPTPIENGSSLSWKRRVYSYKTYREKPLKNKLRKDIISFNPRAWHEAVSAISQGASNKAVNALREGIEAFDPMSFVAQSPCGHYMEFELNLHPGDCLPVQLCSVVDRGFPMPSPQLCSPAPGVELCLEHTSRPIDCFSCLAKRAPLKQYKTIKEYQSVWLPLLNMEAVESAVTEGGSILLTDVPVKWKAKSGSKQAVGLEGSFKLSSHIIKDCDLDMDFQNCYICIRMEDLKRCRTTDLFEYDSYTWVAHGLTKVKKNVSKEEGGRVAFYIHQATMKEVPEAVLKPEATFTVEIIQKLLPDIRKEVAMNELKGASELTKSIVLGKHIPDKDMNSKFKAHSSFTVRELSLGLNDSQTGALRKALMQPFTLIQGPPGTGKTIVGAHLVYWFNEVNQDLESMTEDETEEELNGRRVLLYCGPSNKSVDVIAEKLLPLRGKLRMLRVYSEQMELSEFQYPGSNLRVSGYLREGKPLEVLRPITLHHLIRQPTNQYSGKILEMDARIQRREEMTLEEVASYKKLLADARKVELDRHDIILCTCITSSNKVLTSLPVSQVIIDESGMCTEPETLVPIVSHKNAQWIVLIGDHRQLRPVVKNDLCRALKVDQSMFERYQERALLLDTQYRMHSAICKFPSDEFYDGRLLTSASLRLQPSLFSYKQHRCCPLLFGKVEGQEQRLIVTSEEGNINSKANIKEAVQAVRLAKLLVSRSIEAKDIAILTPYNAQVVEVTKRLRDQGLNEVTACTIMKSQGSEWRYVIFSTVRSISDEGLDSRPTYSWLRQNLGFLADPNQINVALTRAKEGLCVLGNPRLLKCSHLWGRLLQHYMQNGAFADCTEITVLSPSRR
ncbi:helicase with zinc finger domain 2 [Bufo gargarizans]|uniref:helicase with zinc finger domain 2 n=1 Tax=Bufo gargarizans TaxID=30331 RepID=UPI001CF57C8B|nr:helicase with zinc finger domain 2 [Bufo gargarizans]